MSVNRWDPFTDLVSLREAMNRLLEESVVRPGAVMTGQPGGQPQPGHPSTARPFPVDVWQTADEIVVRATLPGVSPENVDINVVGETLTIRAQTQAEKEEEGRAWLEAAVRTSYELVRGKLPKKLRESLTPGRPQTPSPTKRR